jgi:hypothetical protein
MSKTPLREPMRTIDLQSWPRREHFAKFGAFHYPHFNVCADVELTALRQAVKERGISFTAAIVYVIARTDRPTPNPTRPYRHKCATSIASLTPAHIESRMSSSWWVGGQDWDGPHRVVGRLVLGHTVP